MMKVQQAVLSSVFIGAVLAMHEGCAALSLCNRKKGNKVKVDALGEVAEKFMEDTDDVAAQKTAKKLLEQADWTKEEKKEFEDQYEERVAEAANKILNCEAALRKLTADLRNFRQVQEDQIHNMAKTETTDSLKKSFKGVEEATLKKKIANKNSELTA